MIGGRRDGGRSAPTPYSPAPESLCWRWSMALLFPWRLYALHTSHTVTLASAAPDSKWLCHSVIKSGSSSSSQRGCISITLEAAIRLLAYWMIQDSGSLVWIKQLPSELCRPTEFWLHVSDTTYSKRIGFLMMVFLTSTLMAKIFT